MMKTTWFLLMNLEFLVLPDNRLVPNPENMWGSYVKKLIIAAVMSKNRIIIFDLKEYIQLYVFFRCISKLILKLHAMNVTNGTLIMDNASIHKTDEVKLRIKGTAF